MLGLYACLAVTCHLYFCHNETGVYAFYFGNMRVERIRKYESAKKVDSVLSTIVHLLHRSPVVNSSVGT